MKILFTGGGTHGHFYPIIAVIEELEQLVGERKLLPPALYFAAPENPVPQLLFDHRVTFVKTSAGKLRGYFTIRNFFDFFKTGWGIITSVIRIFFMYPDVIFAKGGYGSFPTLLAAKLFGIPVVIHESDIVPGRVNVWAGKFAERVALSYAEAASYFPAAKIAHTGNPVRRALMMPATEGAHEFLKLENTTPTLVVLGGSQGAQAINDIILQSLPDLLLRYQIIHQTGEGNWKDAAGAAGVALRQSPEAARRYHPYPYLNELALRMAAGVADLVISRAGSTIFEIAAWGKPSIIIPLPGDVAHEDHQTKNAFAYARSGAATVIEQRNLTPMVLSSEIARIIENKEIAAGMAASAKAFATPKAARTIAEELLAIGLSHE